MRQYSSLSTGRMSRITTRGLSQSRQNAPFRQMTQALTECKRNFQNLDSIVRKQCGLETGAVRGFAGRFLGFLIPRSLHPSLPQSLVKFVAEEQEVLEYIEALMRSNINNAQEGLAVIIAQARERSNDLEGLKNDLSRAEQENWDAQQLQLYIAEQAEIQLLPEVSEFLSVEFRVLSETERDARKNNFLEHIRESIAMGHAKIKMFERVCLAGLEVLNVGITQYWAYTQHYHDMIALKNASQALVDVNHSSYVAKDALRTIYETSVNAIVLALDAAKMVDDFYVNAPDMRAAIENGGIQIEQMVMELRRQIETRFRLKNNYSAKMQISNKSNEQAVMTVEK